MSDVFVLRNHDQLFFNKQGEWSDGSDAASLFRTSHKDEALNQKLELTVRYPDLRITVVNCRLDAKGRPQLMPETDQAAETAPEAEFELEPESQETTTQSA
jgi:hypothetical protein